MSQFAEANELVFHVDECDVVVGPIERDEAHRRETLHRSGVVFLERSDGRILIQHRSSRKSIFPDCYDTSAAFHVKFGESYLEAARRESREEMGVTAELKFLGKFIHHDPPEHQMVAVFLCRSDENVRLDSSESDRADFLSRQEIDRIINLGNVTPWLRDAWRLTRDRVTQSP